MTESIRRAARGASRILPLDDKAALVWARLMAEVKPRSALDMIIAAVAAANDCVVVTANDKGFAGIKLYNPVRRAV